MANVVPAPDWGKSAAPVVVPPPKWGAPQVEVPPPGFIEPSALAQPQMPDFSNVVSGGSSVAAAVPPPVWDAPSTADEQDWGDIQWTRAKRFASSLGENFADVFTETLPTTIREGVNTLGMTAATALFSAPGSALDPLGKAIAGSTMKGLNEAENEMLAAQRERAATTKQGPQTFTDDVLNTVSTSLGKMGAHLVLGGGQPILTLLAMYVDSAKEKEIELLAEGQGRASAELFGAVDGLIESGTEYFGLKYGKMLVDDVLKPGSPVLKKLAQYFAADWTGEQVATVAGSINDAVAKGQTADEWLTNLKQQMPVSMVSPVVTSGVQLAAQKATSAGATAILDGILKREEERAPAEFTPLDPKMVKVRDILFNIKNELAGLQQQEADLTGQIGGLPALHSGVLDVQAAVAAGTPGNPAALGVWDNTGRHVLQPGSNVPSTDPFVKDLVLNRGPNGEALNRAPGVDWINGNKFEPGTYLGTTDRLEEAERGADEMMLKARLGGELPGTFEYERIRAFNQQRRKTAKVMRETVEEIQLQVEEWRKMYLPNSAVVTSYDRDEGMPTALGTQLTITNQGKDIVFLNLKLNKIFGDKMQVVYDQYGRAIRAGAPSKQDLRRSMDVMAHEFGHALATKWERDLSAHEVRILRQAYVEDVLAKTARRDAGEAQRTDMTQPKDVRKQGYQRSWGSESMIEPPDMASNMAKARIARQYSPGQAVTSDKFWGTWGTYVEWMAHQMGKTWRHQAGKETAVDKIMRPIRRAMDHFYRKNRSKWMPNSTYELFLNRALVQNRIDSLQEKRLKAEMAFTKAVRRMKANPPETVLVDRFGSIMRGGKGGRGKPPGGSWLPTGVQEGAKEAMARFSWYIKQTSGLLHLAELNAFMPGLLRSDRENALSYVQLQYKQNGIQNAWKERMYTLARSLIKSMPLRGARDWIGRFNSFIFEADSLSSKLERKLTIDELAALQGKYKLSERDVAMAERIWTYMRDAVTALENTRKKQLTNMLLKGTLIKEDYDRQMKDMTRDFAALRNRNYMPHTRFGKYVLHGKSMQKNLKIDDYYTAKRIGDTAIFETFANKKDLLKAQAEYENRWGRRIKFETNEATENEQMFLGFDPALVRQIIAGLGMDEQQAAELNTLMVKLSPSEGFRKRLIERKGIPGYSTHTVRVISDYGARFGNFLSRMETADEMKEAIEEMKASAKGVAGIEGVKRGNVIAWVERHMQYMMNPGNELAGLRAAGFLWYIGLVPKSAVVNLTQVPLVAYPYLAARFKSDLGATRELSKAMAKVTQVHKGTSRYSAGEQQMMDDLLHLMDESFASMLGGLQEGSVLERMTQGRFVGDERVALAIHEFQNIAGWMFSAAEKYNRRIVGVAAYNLAIQQGKSHDDAVTEARLALERTQFEYARFNRPELMRGKKSAFFLFQQYTVNMLQFLGRKDGGRGRYLLMMLMLGGLQGLPFGDIIIDMVDWFATKYKEMLGLKNPKVQLRAEIRDLLVGLSEGSPYIPDMSDVVLRGVSANMGPWDVSGSVGFGRPIPGTESLAREGMSPKEKAAQVVADLAGPLVALPIAGLTAMGSDDPDVWKRFEKILPTAVQGVSKARRFWANEQETDYYGDPTVSFDRTNPWHVAEMVGQAMGFTPSRVTETRQKQWMAQEAIKYYEGRQTILMRSFEAAVRAKDPIEMANVIEAVKEYNDDVPHPAFKISGKSMKQSVKAKLTRSELVKLGFGREKRYAGFYTEYLDAITADNVPITPPPSTVPEPQWGSP